MLKKTIVYEDFNGEEVSEDFFFHLTQAELVELELSHKDGLSTSLQRIIDAEDGKGIVEEFQNIILSAYGQKSPDGRRFVKNDAVREDFKSTGAYSKLFMELVTDTDAAIEFVNGVIPKGMAEEAAKLTALAPVPEPEPEVSQEEVSEPEILTRKEILEMSPEEIETLGDRLAKGEVKIDPQDQVEPEVQPEPLA